MLPRYLAKLVSLGSVSAKRNVHSYARIADTQCKEKIGTRTKVQGWVRAIRKMKECVFVELTDGSTDKYLQLIIQKTNKPANLAYGSSVTAEGELTLAPDGRVELQAANVTVIGTCDVLDGYPFAPRKSYPPDYIRQYLHLRPRTKYFSSLLRLRDAASIAIRDHLHGRDFIEVNTPILTSNDCEGAGEVFSVKPNNQRTLAEMKKQDVLLEDSYFSTKVFLTVSAQLQLETMARALTRVYTFGPTFRAENSKSRYHLSEFYMVEAEMAFVTSVEELVKETELLTKVVLGSLLDRCASDYRIVNSSPPTWLNEKFACLTYDEAYNILQSHADNFTTTLSYGEAFTKEQELYLVKHNNDVPMFVVNWPKEDKPFYMKKCKGDDSKVSAMDLLAPAVGEIVGGSVREDDYDTLKEKLPANSNLDWYLELRKHGNVPTGGFGMGFERFLQSILNVPNIKETIPFPRWPHNCSV